MAEPLVLLHGFAGTGRSWEEVVAHVDRRAYAPICPDLRGHGASAHERPVDADHAIADVLAAAPARVVLAGYSLGGRIALRVALAAPERVARLVLVATTAGIEDPEERTARAVADDALAGRMEAMDADAWVTAWTGQAIFAGTPPAARAAWEADLRRNDPRELAVAMRGLSGGRMAPVWERLGELSMPVTVVVGERDDKYRAYAERLVAGLPDPRPAAPIVVADAGHGLPREAPVALAAALVAGAEG